MIGITHFVRWLPSLYRHAGGSNSADNSEIERVEEGLTKEELKFHIIAAPIGLAANPAGSAPADATEDG